MDRHLWVGGGIITRQSIFLSDAACLLNTDTSFNYRHLLKNCRIQPKYYVQRLEKKNSVIQIFFTKPSAAACCSSGHSRVAASV